jgi:hypothetical protein
VLQEQQVPLDVPEEPESEDEEEDSEEIEGVSDLDSEHGDPEPVTVHVLVMLDLYFVSVKYVLVSIKLVCIV